MTNPTPHGQVPAIQRFEVVDCIDDKHVPAVIPKPHGPWVRYEDHIAALAEGQATAAQQPGAAYAALPTHSHAGQVYEEGFLIGTCPLYTADKMRAFADATHALRAESLATAYREELDKLSQRNYELRHAPHGHAPAGESPRTIDVPCDEYGQERIAFKDAHRHLELDEVPDAWARPMFKHSHVEASWLGWIARAAQEGK